MIHEKVEYLLATNRFLDLVLHTTEAPPDALEDLRLCMGELGMNVLYHDVRAEVWLDAGDHHMPVRAVQTPAGGGVALTLQRE